MRHSEPEQDTSDSTQDEWASTVKEKKQAPAWTYMTWAAELRNQYYPNQNLYQSPSSPLQNELKEEENERRICSWTCAPVPIDITWTCSSASFSCFQDSFKWRISSWTGTSIPCIRFPYWMKEVKQAIWRTFAALYSWATYSSFSCYWTVTWLLSWTCPWFHSFSCKYLLFFTGKLRLNSLWMRVNSWTFY